MDDKLAQALHIIINEAEKKKWPLGAVKLTKSMVFSEAASLYIQGRPITGVKIVKAPQGPVPDGYKEALKRLEAEGRIKITESDQKFEPTVYQSLSEPDLTGFSEQDLKIIFELTATCCNEYTAQALSKETHDYFWKIVGMGKKIPLSAYLWPEDYEGEPISDEEMAQLDQAMRGAALNV